MKVTPVLLFKAMSLHLGSKTKQNPVTCLQQNERKDKKQVILQASRVCDSDCRPLHSSGNVSADASRG